MNSELTPPYKRYSQSRPTRVIFSHGSHNFIMLPGALRGFFSVKNENKRKAVWAVPGSKICVRGFGFSR